MIEQKLDVGFAGFIGFMSIRYFCTGNVIDLTPIGFFGFFYHFIIAKISGSKADERYIENKRAALAFTGELAMIELFILWVAVILNDMTIDIIRVLVSLSYAITPN